MTSSTASPKTSESGLMAELNWQKSTYSEQASSCVYVASTPTNTIFLRESDEPATILTTSPRQLAYLITALHNTQTGGALRSGHPYPDTPTS